MAGVPRLYPPPQQTYPDGSLAQSIWGGLQKDASDFGAMLQGMWSGATAPGRALAGEYDQVQVSPSGSVSMSDPRMVDDAAQLGGLVSLGSVGMVPRNALGMGIKAYHGSPHSFDRFDMGKIGTGEGAQAYGHGLYFAESPKVAEGYRDALSQQVSFDGVPVAASHHSDSPHAAAVHSVAGDVAKGMPPVEAIVKNAREWREAANRYRQGAKDYPEAAEQANETATHFDEIASAIEALEPESLKKNPGHLYEVDIDAKPEQFLDWDKPLSEQPKAVQDALAAMDDPMFAAWKQTGAWDHVKGETIYRHLAGGNTNGAAAQGIPAKASQQFREAGIKGIRYLDAGSRGTGDGSRNYVLFDDKPITITDKRAVAGSLPSQSAGAASRPVRLST